MEPSGSKRLVLPVPKLVHGHREVCWKLRVAGVRIVVVFREEVDIMEEDAAPVFIPECLTHPNIQQLGTVKSGVSRLRKKRWRGGSYKSDMRRDVGSGACLILSSEALGLEFPKGVLHFS